MTVYRITAVTPNGIKLWDGQAVDKWLKPVELEIGIDPTGYTVGEQVNLVVHTINGKEHST